MSNPNRRELLASTAIALLSGPLVSAPTPAAGAVIKGALPWTPGRVDPPVQVQPGPWQYFTKDEATCVEALVDRLIPPDPETPGGKDTGCAVFIDRQLAGPYGSAEDHYMGGPFHSGTKEQGD